VAVLRDAVGWNVMVVGLGGVVDVARWCMQVEAHSPTKGTGDVVMSESDRWPRGCGRRWWWEGDGVIGGGGQDGRQCKLGPNHA